VAGSGEGRRRPRRLADTFTIITTTATDDVGHVHDRMPMTIEPDRWDEWLDPTRSDPDALMPLMAPPAAGSLQIYPVTPAVNNVRSNGPQLIQPIQVSADPTDPAGPR
jgi:putative SOS response-associated peptidase YedK